MVTTGLIVRLEAKAGKEDDLAAFLADALPLVQDEPETVAWFAVRKDTSSFAIVDAFPDEAGRQAHLGHHDLADALAAHPGSDGRLVDGLRRRPVDHVEAELFVGQDE